MPFDDEDERRRSIFLMNPEDLMAEIGDEKDADALPGRRARPAEQQAAAEITVFLEDDLGIDTRRLYIQVRDGYLFIQGSVETEEQRKEMEELLPQRSQIRGIELQVSVQQSQ